MRHEAAPGLHRHRCAVARTGRDDRVGGLKCSRLSTDSFTIQTRKRCRKVPKTARPVDMLTGGLTMALLPSHRTPPTFQPIVVNEPLTDAEKAALRADARLEAYPTSEWLTAREMAFCAFVRWQFPKGDNDG